MPNKPPAYQHYAKDWLVGTAHLTLEQQGAYQRLLDHEWDDGPLPDSDIALARLLGVTLRLFKAVIWPALERHFPLTRDMRRANPRLEFERDKQDAYREHQSRAGQASGRARQKLNTGSNHRSNRTGNRIATEQATEREPKGNFASSSSFAGGETPQSPPKDKTVAQATRGNGVQSAGDVALSLVRGLEGRSA